MVNTRWANCPWIFVCWGWFGWATIGLWWPGQIPGKPGDNCWPFHGWFSNLILQSFWGVEIADGRNLRVADSAPNEDQDTFHIAGKSILIWRRIHHPPSTCGPMTWYSSYFSHRGQSGRCQQLSDCQDQPVQHIKKLSDNIFLSHKQFCACHKHQSACGLCEYFHKNTITPNCCAVWNSNFIW